MDKIVGGQYPEVHAMLIYKDGKLVLEEYFQGHEYKWDAPMHHGDWVTWNRDKLHQIHSDTKSITSACVGIAIDQGFIESVHQSIFDYFPEYQHLNTDGKDKITIEHLLTMTSGLDANEWTVPYSSPENPSSDCGFHHARSQSVAFWGETAEVQTGTHFTYFGGNQILLERNHPPCLRAEN
ncbi:MAG: serine hydrolase domain-containing protein [Saprospiraceae bacterium]